MKKQILFVDDDAFVLSALRRLLFSYREHWDVDFINSGEKALRCMSERPYDVVISDMRMPGMDGAELLDNVRNQFPISVRIILSGQSDDQVGLDALGPAHQYFAKPCDPRLLKATISRLGALRERVGNDVMLAVVSQIEALPSLPTAYQQFQLELESNEPSIERVAEIVSQDVAMTAKVSQLVSSTIFGLSQPITDPVKAVKFLGVKHLQPLARSTHVFKPLEQTELRDFDFKGLVEDSRAVARLAREIATTFSDDTQLGDDAYLAGLLHDVGMLVISIGFAEPYQQILDQARESKSALCQLEQQTWSTNHADVGAYLSGLWGLRDSILQAVAFHHEPTEARDHGDFTPLTAVHIADALIHEKRGEAAYAPIDARYVARLGLSDFVEECRARQMAIAR